MTAIISNIQNKPVLLEQAKPIFNSANNPSKDIEEEQNTVRPITSTISKKVEEESSEQALDDAISQLNSYVQSINRNLEFNVDNTSGETVVKVIDSETEELIRQIPNEEALNIAKQLDIGVDNFNDSGLLLAKIKA